MLHAQIALNKDHAVCEVLVEIRIFLIFMVQSPHHVILEMLEQKHLVVEFARVVIDRVIRPVSVHGVAFARCVDMVKVSALSAVPRPEFGLLGVS